MGFKINSLYLTDGYKVGHQKMLAPGTTKLYGTWIPRSIKYAPKGVEKIVSFGQQLVWKWLHDEFEENFFNPKTIEYEVWYDEQQGNRPCKRIKSIKEGTKEDALKFAKDMSLYLGMEYDGKHFEELWDLGYLPIKVKALPEGIETNPNVPHMTFVNTVDGFAWLTLYLETIVSSLAWKPSTIATIAKLYHKQAKEWVLKTDKENIGLVPFMCHDFSARGLDPMSQILCGLGWATSFLGSDTLPVIPASRYFYGVKEDEMPIYSVNACFPDGAEILTDKGFLDFKDLSYSDKVAQYNQDGTIEFVKPTKLHSYDFNGNLLSFVGGSEGQINFCVTDNHRIPYIASNGSFVIKEAKDLPLKPVFKISGLAKIENGELNDFEKLLIAFQADGSYSTRDNEYTGFRKGTLPMRFPTLKKERKIKRLEELLDKLNFNYTKSTYEKGNSYRIEVPFTKDLSKTFNWVDLTNVSSKWCRSFIEELQYWSGSLVRKNTIVYSSVLKENVDMIQAIASMGGVRTHYKRYEDKRVNRETIHHLTITLDRFDYNPRENLTVEKIVYNGKVRCVTVPSGMFVARQNNRVIISGNSEHSVSTTKIFTVGEQQMIADWLQLFPQGILSIVSDTFDLWKLITEYLPANKEAIMSRDGKLVIRPDSGNPVDIICGRGLSKLERVEYGGKGLQPEHKGVIELLWDIFGGTINEQGYKVLDPHIGCIYGDSITPERQFEIYKRLADKGFSASNIILGVGSYTMQYNTRDTLGFAAKGAWFEVGNVEFLPLTSEDGTKDEPFILTTRKSYNIYKDPVTDDGTKKSLKGMCGVIDDGLGNLYVKEECTPEEENQGLLQVIYENGKFYNQITLNDVRYTIQNGL